MRFLRLIPLAAVVFAGACDEDGAVTNAVRPPLAYIRYVNAVPDTGAMDFKFIDQVEYSPTYPAYTFRTVGYYQGAEAGARQIRVFANSSTIGVTSVPIIDTTITFTAGTYYTILHAGNTRAAAGSPTADRLIVIDDTRPAQDAGLHISGVNTSTAGVDFGVLADTGTAFAVTHANVAYGTRTPYGARATGLFAVQVSPTGAGVANAKLRAPIGLAGNALVSRDPVGGYNVAGTQLSAFYFPAGVAGSPAASFTTPGIVFFVDRQPPRVVPD